MVISCSPFNRVWFNCSLVSAPLITVKLIPSKILDGLLLSRYKREKYDILYDSLLDFSSGGWAFGFACGVKVVFVRNESLSLFWLSMKQAERVFGVLTTMLTSLTQLAPDPLGCSPCWSFKALRQTPSFTRTPPPVRYVEIKCNAKHQRASDVYYCTRGMCGLAAPVDC